MNKLFKQKILYQLLTGNESFAHICITTRRNVFEKSHGFRNTAIYVMKFSRMLEFVQKNTEKWPKTTIFIQKSKSSTQPIIFKAEILFAYFIYLFICTY